MPSRRELRYGRSKSTLRPRRTDADRLFTEDRREYVCEETGDEVVLMKDAKGHVIGFEKLNFSTGDLEDVSVEFETVPS